MFESALGRSEASSTRLGTGAILSAAVHALFAAVVFIVPGKTKAHQEQPTEALVIQIAQPTVAPGGSPGPAAPAPKAEAPAPQPKAAPKPVAIPDKPAPETPPEQPQAPTNSDAPTGSDSAANSGPPAGGEGGGSGSGGGTGGNGPGTGNGPTEEKPTYTVLSWNASMERPVQIAGPAHPEYPRNAMLQHREGVVLAKCRITTDGAVRDCSIIKGDVMLQQAALDALAQQRYRPLLYGGVPVSVWYTFRFTFKLQ